MKKAQGSTMEKESQKTKSENEQTFARALDTSTSKILSVGGLVTAILLALLLGLAFVVRSLKNVTLTLNLELKRDDRAEKKY